MKKTKQSNKIATAERFSNTVENYRKYRPDYPADVLQVMINECQLIPAKVVADIGSGTGFLTQLFLDYGNQVFAVEPNDKMRLAGESDLKSYTNFVSVKGTAEATTLASASVDLVTVGTAFHWFDADKTKLEFKRILKTPGYVLLVWNVRDKELSPLVADYEDLILQYTHYKDVPVEKFSKDALIEFFKPAEMHTATFANPKHYNWPEFQGRLLSSSFSLREDEPQYEAMLHALKTLFDRYQQNGKLSFLYRTELYFGRMK